MRLARLPLMVTLGATSAAWAGQRPCRGSAEDVRSLFLPPPDPAPIALPLTWRDGTPTRVFIDLEVADRALMGWGPRRPRCDVDQVVRSGGHVEFPDPGCTLSTSLLGWPER